jgi:hypothetical protein
VICTSGRVNERDRKDRQQDRTEHRRQAAFHDGVAHGRRGGEQAVVGDAFDHRDRRTAAEAQGLPTEAEGRAGSVHQHGGGGAIVREDVGELGKLVLDAQRLAARRAEFTALIRMQQIGAVLVHHIETPAFLFFAGRADRRKSGAHVEIDDQDAERLAVGGKDRRGHPHRGGGRAVARSAALVDGRHMHFALDEPDRRLEIRAVADAL